MADVGAERVESRSEDRRRVRRRTAREQRRSRVATEQPSWEGSYGSPYFDGNDRLGEGGKTLNGAGHTRLVTWAVLAFLGGVRKAWGLGSWASNSGFGFGVNNGYKGWEYAGGNGWLGTPTVFGPQTGTLYFVVASVGPTDADCFIRENGVDVSSEKHSGAIGNRTGELVLGGRPGGEFWYGGIAELGIAWDVTDAEVALLERYLASFWSGL